MSKPKSQSNKPKFIVIEGGEGSGKSTLMIALKELMGEAIMTTREPGGSPYAEVIREATLKNPLAKTAPAETTLCLMFAARFDNTQNSILPAIKKGLPVIADRFDGSSYAYQICAQSNGQLEDIFWSLRGRLAIIPDLYIFVDVTPEEGVRRANRRNQSLLKGKQYDHFDDREIAFHKKVRDGYLIFFEKIKAMGTPYVVINANKSLEEVKKDFIGEVKKQLDIL